jgi:hypothetical protein
MKRHFNCEACGKLLKEGEGDMCDKCSCEKQMRQNCNYPFCASENFCYKQRPNDSQPNYYIERTTDSVLGYKYEKMGGDAMSYPIDNTKIGQKGEGSDKECSTCWRFYNDKDTCHICKENNLHASIDEYDKAYSTCTLSPQDKLKEIVEKMLVKWSRSLQTISVYNVYKENNGKWMIVFATDGEPDYEHSFSYLITNAAAMKALFGEKELCDNCRSIREPFIPCEGCTAVHGKMTTAYIYHGLKAAELHLKNQQDTAIDYLWREMK